MKTLTYITVCMLPALGVFSARAQVERCGAMKLLAEHQAQNPKLREQMMLAETNAKNWTITHKKTTGAIVSIPTVVHVIYNASMPEQNIPDSVIFSQLEVLNEDFRRRNADTVNTRAIFDSIAADVEVEFCLASFDTAGNAVSGIHRVATTKTGFEVFGAGMNDMKSAATGGADPWPKDQYLNLWICNMTVFGIPGAILGFAQFPGDDPATDGVVIQYNYIGRTSDPVQSDSSLGRTVTHEVGHWLGLRHIWADDQDFFGNGTCDSSDFVDDTPNQAGQSNYDCDTVINSCSNEAPSWGSTDPPDMVENYMDYSSDSCSNLFTLGQKERMSSFLYTDRAALLSSPGCGLTSITSSPACSGSCDGQASVSVLAGTPPFYYLWSDPGAQTGETAMGLCAGYYSVTIIDSLGEVFYDSVAIDQLDPVAATLTTADATCQGCNDGSVTVSVTGGLPPYTYLWTDSTGNVIDPFPFTGLSEGAYVSVINDGCGQQVTGTFSIGAPVSLDHPLQRAFQVFPNPTSGLIQLRPDPNSPGVTIELVDPPGRIVGEYTLTGPGEIDLSRLDAGIYFLKTRSGNQVMTIKILLLR